MYDIAQCKRRRRRDGWHDTNNRFIKEVEKMYNEFSFHERIREHRQLLKIEIGDRATVYILDSNANY